MTENKITLTENDETAAALVSVIRAAVRGQGKYAAYVAAHSNVRRDTVKDHALALATLAYPRAPQVQKKDGARTLFGNAVQAAGNGLRAALDKDEQTTKPTDWMRLVRQAAENAHVKGEFTPDQIMAEVREVFETSPTIAEQPALVAV